MSCSSWNSKAGMRRQKLWQQLRHLRLPMLVDTRNCGHHFKSPRYLLGIDTGQAAMRFGSESGGRTSKKQQQRLALQPLQHQRRQQQRQQQRQQRRQRQQQ